MLKLSRRLPALVLIVQLSLLSSLTLTQTACPGESMARSDALSLAQEAVAGTKDLLPVFAGAGFSNQYVNTAVEVGERLVEAFQMNADADALTLTASFIDATNNIVSQIDLFKDPTKQTLALAVIAGVRIVLRRVSNYLKPAEEAGKLRAGAPGMRSAAQKVRDFSKAPEWRCRSAQTGRFQKMEYCRAHPDVSTVERVRR